MRRISQDKIADATRALVKHKGNILAASRELGIPKNTMHYLIRCYGLKELVQRQRLLRRVVRPRAGRWQRPHIKRWGTASGSYLEALDQEVRRKQRMRQAKEAV